MMEVPKYTGLASRCLGSSKISSLSVLEFYKGKGVLVLPSAGGSFREILLVPSRIDSGLIAVLVH